MSQPQPEETGGPEGQDDEPTLDDNIRTAVAKLNPEDDAHWNAQGQPNANVIKERVGKRVTKTQIAAATDDYNRSNAYDTAGITPPPPPEEAQEQAEIGDVFGMLAPGVYVQRSSGGPRMLISYLNKQAGTVHCDWTNAEGDAESGDFKPSQLVLATGAQG